MCVLCDVSAINNTPMQIVDSGVGIPKEKLSVIFEAFRQVGAVNVQFGTHDRL